MELSNMKKLFLLILAGTCISFPLCHSLGEPAAPLNLGAFSKIIDDDSFFIEPGYATWDGNLFKDKGTYYLIYSRWRSRGGDWLTTSEACIAKSNKIEGPYKHVKVLLRGRGPSHWDELNVHNPKLKKYDGKYYLYYISARAGDTRSHVRDSQRTGVAVADNIMGPYERLDRPIVEPAAPIHNITVNPGVTQTPDGGYLMILKGDKVAKTPTERMGQRIQGIAKAKSPEGPFEIQPKLAIKDVDTEDASLWYDEVRKRYFAIYHAHKYVGLITSQDGINWQPAEHPEVMRKEILKKDGTMMKLNCVERPFVFIEDGKPAALCVSVRRGRTYNTGACLVIPLTSPAEKKR